MKTGKKRSTLILILISAEKVPRTNELHVEERWEFLDMLLRIDSN